MGGPLRIIVYLLKALVSPGKAASVQGVHRFIGGLRISTRSVVAYMTHAWFEG
jgi:hypothetical protein